MPRSGFLPLSQAADEKSPALRARLNIRPASERGGPDSMDQTADHASRQRISSSSRGVSSCRQHTEMASCSQPSSTGVG